ncbi:General transcription factor 3C polypeptide 3 [Rhynchospora pubera]|uniref:General transcription factor 3C polypeptide 3 n=1 Tax=Rhynchospora pubera TaxID=906938 RepID=A0AAV8FR02_9POAL|nr:General transcription factor 3C polypeptide 3 [Rhynchospora pubera]
MEDKKKASDKTVSATTEMEVGEAAGPTEGEEGEERAIGEEGDEEEAEGEGEGEEEGDERCEFEFEIGTDPVDLVQEAPDGVELYQRFERLENEAIEERERKRKAVQHQQEGPSKKPRQDEFLGATMEEIDELMNFGFRRRRSRGSCGKKGRRKGSRKKLNPIVSAKIAQATIHYASKEYNEAIPLLHDVVRLAPNIADGYHLLGLVHDSLHDRKKAFNFHMIAAFFSRKDASLWKKLVSWSIKMGDVALVKHCLSKAMIADPDDFRLKFDAAMLYFNAGEFLKAAELYEQILRLSPENAQACIMAAKMYRKCGRTEKGIQILEDFVNSGKQKSDLSVIELLINLYMSNNAHNKALQQIDKWHAALDSEKLPFHLEAKATICCAHLGDMSHAEVFLHHLPLEATKETIDVVAEVADSFFEMGKYDYALKFYFKLEFLTDNPNGDLYKKIAQCYMSLKERSKAVPFFYKALNKMEENVEIRLTLASIILEEGKEDETIILLSPSDSNEKNSQPKSWWLNSQVKIQLAKVYHSKGMLESFVNTIYSSVRDTLIIESINQKLRPVKKLSKHVLIERAKLLAEQEPDSVFHGFRPLASSAELLKASRAKKLLEKRAALKEQKRAVAIASGLEWHTDDSDEEPQRREKQEPPLPGFLQKQENHQLLVDLCKALASLQRYWEALEIINKALKVAHDDIFSSQRKEELRSLGAEIAYGTTDPKHGFDYVKYIVQQHPYSNAAWNCYYKVVSRLEDRYSKHNKFVRYMRNIRNDCIPPIIISGHQFNSISQHQAATADYLEAYKLQPDNPLINLCVGTSLINLALGFRLKNKHHSIIQGFAFLYKYLHLCENSQEALYNIARAYHHVGLVTLAASYYEKVLAMHEKDEPVPRLPYEKPPSDQQDPKSNYCDLRREAAYNLHLIYKKSGAVDLARQILKDYCTV